jgi:hypothetical protein
MEVCHRHAELAVKNANVTAPQVMRICGKIVFFALQNMLNWLMWEIWMLQFL